MWYLIPQAFQSGLPDLQDNQHSENEAEFSFFLLLSFTAIQHKDTSCFVYFNNPRRLYVSKNSSSNKKKKKLKKWLMSGF